MFKHTSKLVFVSLIIASIVGGVFGNYHPASAAIVFDETAGLYTDDFADATGIAASADAGVNAGAVQLKNAGGTYTAPYLASGTVTLNLIRPTRVAEWGTLSIVATTPAGTSINAQILDDASHVFRNVYLAGNEAGISTFPIDLSNVPVLECADQYLVGDAGSSFLNCSKVGAVKIKFILTSSDPNETPLIDSMQFTYTVTQGDLSSSGPASYLGTHEQGTNRLAYGNPAVYPAFRWVSSRFEGDSGIYPHWSLSDKIVGYSAMYSGYLFGLNSQTGSSLWSLPFGGEADKRKTISQNGTFYGTDGAYDYLYAIDTLTGGIKWGYYFGGGHSNGSTIVGSDGTIYTVRNNIGTTSTIYAFNPNGTIKWTLPIVAAPEGVVDASSMSIGADGTLYFSTNVRSEDYETQYDTGRLYAVYTSGENMGTVKWFYATGDTALAPPAIDPSGTIYVGKRSNKMDREVKIFAIHSLGEASGTLKWERSFDVGDRGFIDLALRNDGKLWAYYAAASNNILLLSEVDGSTVATAASGLTITGGIIADDDDGLFFSDANSSAYPLMVNTLRYFDADRVLRWQLPYAYDFSDGLFSYSLNGTTVDDRGWTYVGFGRTSYNESFDRVPQNEYSQVFALAPWTLTPASSPATLYRGNTLTFSVTTSMQQTNPLTSEANKMQIVLEDNTKIPLVYSSTNGDGDTIWTADLAIPSDAAWGTYNYTVEANAALIKTDIVTAFASPATGSDNTGLTAAGTYTVARSGVTPSSGGGSVSAPSIAVRTPAAGAIYAPNTTVGLEWTPTNGTFTKYKVSYSANNGTTWTSINDNATSTALSWIVPDINTTQGLIKVEGYDGNGNLLATGISGTFTMTGKGGPGSGTSNQTPTTDSTISGTYDPAMAMANNPDINTDKGLSDALPFTAWCVSGSLIKTEASSAVYYCGKDGKRYVFVNDKAYFSWYPDFSTVQIINEQTMAEIALGGNITYRPGSRMVKIQSDPKVYAVARGGILRWVQSEAIAVRLYGTAWNTMIDDVPDSFFVNYTVGEAITE